MSQLKRACCFKNCTVTHGDPNYTLFAFPRSVDRYRLWDRIAGSSHITDPRKFLCEKHFNPIHIATNPRRKLLLHSAVPLEEFDCDLRSHQKIQQDKDEPNTELGTTSTVENYLLYKNSVGQINTIMIHNQDDINQIAHSLDLCPIYTANCQDNSIVADLPESEKLTNGYSLSYSHLLNGASNEDSRIERLDISLVLPAEDDEVLDDIEEICSEDKVENIADSPTSSSECLVTTSIISGIEYIQMPKSMYLEEKHRLETELNYYKAIVRNFKKQLDEV